MVENTVSPVNNSDSSATKHVGRKVGYGVMMEEYKRVSTHSYFLVIVDSNYSMVSS